MILIILPNQLFQTKIIKNIINQYDVDKIVIIEEPRYFTDYKFHKLKLAYHRATMKKYFNKINKIINTTYVEFNESGSFYKKNKKQNFIIINPIDHKLESKLKKNFKNHNIIDNPNFLLTISEIKENKDLFYDNKKNKFSHDKFYKFQRKKLNILMDEGKPTGGKWSYDNMNREPLKKNVTIPDMPKKINNKYTIEAIKYINKNFPNNYGSLENFIYPIDRKTSLKWLNNFLECRLKNYGKYQDAVNTEYPFVFHSILSPMMNIGLITDNDVIKVSNAYYLKNKNKIPINSYEGFIRQVIGWRNYVYSVYILKGKQLYKMNHLKHMNKLNNTWWEGNTGIIVLDDIINNIVKYAYSHHIERLMYLGNILLMLMVNPKEVHRIFMEWTIDSYDWVMVPNIMGMSQYSDGGIMMTRPYFASSNYIKKMSNYRKTKDSTWNVEWDSVYYNFINQHLKLLRSNYATSRMVLHWDRKDSKEKTHINKTAKSIISRLTC